MNKVEYLLRALDRVFGFEDKKRSAFRKRSEWFDQKSNEHVILIEYRTSRKGQIPVATEPANQQVIRKIRNEGASENERGLLDYIIAV